VDEADARRAPDRRTWLRELRRHSERQEDALAVLATGRPLVGVDHSGGSLGQAGSKSPGVRTEKRGLEGLRYRAEFEGVMCVDAMEFVYPEDWPEGYPYQHVLARLAIEGASDRAAAG
jgi:hypothetical protein